ncbi:hypothetical protein PPL_11572 [Heterostelium album PN500]|uniref:Uncharacterized protein n=1 Tax=Heterostelium pallidum (strain ATCC 26659 / Pp 5 / PN500) TaxID=670386 RepID=D3BVI1_HETP5|nr:hypothetical protein PPL_11572 [Heterostelium album PN500]EFA74604.1 hypothetical protein PPL_11572 [Heterostelium album PN500]|eukprot:XP_020426738.1 hypothetical protein PPL_11572 [Heterostelium album PN500]
MKANNFFQTFKVEVLNGMQELPLGFRTMLAEGVPSTHPPRPRGKVATIYSPIDRYARDFAREYPEIGYLEEDDPDEGESLSPADDLTLSKRVQRRNARDQKDYYSAVNEDDDLSPEDLELELSQDSFNFANFKIAAMKKGLSEEQAHHQAIRDIFNSLEQREIELNLIRQQANAIGIPSFDPQQHLSYLTSLYKTVSNRREEFVFMMHRDELEESLRLKKYYGETAPVTFDQVSHFSPEEYDLFIAEHPEYKELLAQPIKVSKDSTDAEIKDSLAMEKAKKEKKAAAIAAAAAEKTRREAAAKAEQVELTEESTPEERITYYKERGIPLPKDGIEFQEEELDALIEDNGEALKRVEAYRKLLETLEEEELEALNAQAGFDLLDELDEMSIELQMEIGKELLETVPIEEEDGVVEPTNEYGNKLSDYHLAPEEDLLGDKIRAYCKEKGIDSIHMFDRPDYDEESLDFMFGDKPEVDRYDADGDADEASPSQFSKEVDSFNEKLNEMENEKWIKLDKNEFIQKVFKDNRSPFADLSVTEDGTIVKATKDDPRELFKNNYADSLWSESTNIEYPVVCSREAINQLNDKKQISPELAKYFNIEASPEQTAATEAKLQQYYESDLANLDTFNELNRFQEVPPTTYKAVLNVNKFNEAFEKTLDQAVNTLYVDPEQASTKIKSSAEVDDIDVEDAAPQGVDSNGNNSTAVTDAAASNNSETRNLLLMLKASNELDNTNEKINQISQLFEFKENEQIKSLLAEKDQLFGNKEPTVEDYLQMDEATFARISSRVSQIDSQIKQLQAVATLKENLATRYSDRYRRQKVAAIDRIRGLQRRQVELEKRLNRIEHATPELHRLVTSQQVESPLDRAAEALFEGIASVDSQRARTNIIEQHALPVSQQLIQSVWPTIDLETKKRILSQFKQQKLQQQKEQQQEQQPTDDFWYLQQQQQENNTNETNSNTNNNNNTSADQYDPKNYKNLKDLFTKQQ